MATQEDPPGWTKPQLLQCEIAPAGTFLRRGNLPRFIFRQVTHNLVSISSSIKNESRVPLARLSAALWLPLPFLRPSCKPRQLTDSKRTPGEQEAGSQAQPPPLGKDEWGHHRRERGEGACGLRARCIRGCARVGTHPGQLTEVELVLA